MSLPEKSEPPAWANVFQRLKREAGDPSNQDIAREASVAPTTVGNLLNGKVVNPRSGSVERVIHAYLTFKIKRETRAKKGPKPDVQLADARYWWDEYVKAGGPTENRRAHAGAGPHHLADCLGDYLTAARRAATYHPYWVPLAGLALEHTLNDIYRPRQVALLADSGKELVRQSIGQLISTGRTSLIFGPPGGGKTSLLRQIVRQRLDDSESLPVLVPARALVERPFADAMASAVSADLRDRGLVSELPAQLFQTGPRPGVRWLVLIDALDEIADEHARRKVLAMIAELGVGTHQESFQFLLTTRALPHADFALLGSDATCYSLVDFDGEDVRAVATAWFTASGATNPPERARQFQAALDRQGLTTLARVPLMTSILAQLHIAQPDAEFPASRGQAFHTLTTMLSKRQRQAAHPAGAPWVSVVTAMPRLIERLAKRVHDEADGTEESLLPLLAECPEAALPAGVHVDQWDTFLADCLLGTGVVRREGDELIFAHRTLMEYLAACHVMRDRDTRARALAAIEGRWVRHWPWAPAPGFRRIRGIGRRIWPLVPEEDLSYLGFLLDNGITTTNEQNKSLRVLASKGGTHAGQFLGLLRQQGVKLPAEVVAAATAQMIKLALPTPDEERTVDLWEHPERLDPQAETTQLEIKAAAIRRYGRVLAAEALYWLGDNRAPDVLARLASRPYVTTGEGRVTAAVILAEIDNARGVPLLYDLATDTRLGNQARMNAAVSLATVADDDQGVALLDGWATSPDGKTSSEDEQLRLWAAWTLAQIGDERGRARLAEIACHPARKPHWRINAARLLVDDFADPRGAELLTRLAADPTVPAIQRRAARRPLAGVESQS